MEFAVLQQVMMVVAALVSALWVWKAGIAQQLFNAREKVERETRQMLEDRLKRMERELAERIAFQNDVKGIGDLTHGVRARIENTVAASTLTPAPVDEKQTVPAEPDRSNLPLEERYVPEQWRSN